MKKSTKAKCAVSIDVYPDCKKPDWLAVGATCMCLGEGFETFRVSSIGKNAAILEKLNGKCHGWESFEKLYISMKELEDRRPSLRSKR